MLNADPVQKKARTIAEDSPDEDTESSGPHDEAPAPKRPRSEPAPKPASNKKITARKLRGKKYVSVSEKPKQKCPYCPGSYENLLSHYNGRPKTCGAQHRGLIGPVPPKESAAAGPPKNPSPLSDFAQLRASVAALHNMISSLPEPKVLSGDVKSQVREKVHAAIKAYWDNRQAIVPSLEKTTEVVASRWRAWRYIRQVREDLPITDLDYYISRCDSFFQHQASDWPWLASFNVKLKEVAKSQDDALPDMLAAVEEGLHSSITRFKEFRLAQNVVQFFGISLEYGKHTTPSQLVKTPSRVISQASGGVVAVAQ
jgi:hypothetical protein